MSKRSPGNKRPDGYPGSETREGRIWSGIKQRCYDKNCPAYKYYGGRGIRVCDRWMKDFKNFWDDMGSSYKKDLTIDRIDNDGDYEPGNCKWSTMKDQCNNRRSNVRVTYKGKTQNIEQWSKEVGIKYATLYFRIVVSGWDLDKAMSPKLNLMPQAKLTPRKMRLIRKLKGTISQHKIAKRIGVSHTAISNFLNGKSYRGKSEGRL